MGLVEVNVLLVAVFMVVVGQAVNQRVGQSAEPHQSKSE
jgi:hypothetical protein